MDINISLVRRLISRQFPKWTALPIEPVELGGWDNRTFRLGANMTVRLPSHGAYEAQVEKEQQWFPRLASGLPVAIPTPLAMGTPSDEYPLHWSIYSWIDGETRHAIAHLNCMIGTAEATAVWDSALQAMWSDSPVWVHGDKYPTNLLVKDRRLRAVIDFGCSAIGDPACDLTIAWTFFFGQSRAVFRSHLQFDDETWARARGWALWKALITIANPLDAPSGRLEKSRRVIEDVIAEHKQL